MCFVVVVVFLAVSPDLTYVATLIAVAVKGSFHQ